MDQKAKVETTKTLSVKVRKLEKLETTTARGTNG